ncbi:MAG: quinate 5-dehydrogenase [Trueperaceae bacterium]
MTQPPGPTGAVPGAPSKAPLASEAHAQQPVAAEGAVKRAVSVSIGSRQRDVAVEVELLGKRVHIERFGTDGDMGRAAALIRELDGKVDAFGLGGLDLFFVAAGRRYYLRDGLRLAREAKKTPVVCGAGLKDSLERLAVEKLEERIGWKDRRVLMVSAVDRFGMAESLAQHGARVLYGDIIFALGLPVPIYDVRRLEMIARLLLPVISQVPIGWLYPTGKQQESSKSGNRGRHFEWAEVIAGDFHFIKRYAPERLDGKIILTNTTTSQDVEDLRRRGVTQLITTTPRYEGRSLATNLLEAALVAAAGRHPLSNQEYLELIDEAGLEPQVEVLSG